MGPELIRTYQLLGVAHQMVLVLVMLARRVESALRASVVIEKIALQIDCRILQIFEPFIFEELPHLFLRDIIPLFD